MMTMRVDMVCIPVRHVVAQKIELFLNKSTGIICMLHVLFILRLWNNETAPARLQR